LTPARGNDINTGSHNAAACERKGRAATIGKSLMVKGELSGSESLYIDGRVEAPINLPG